jgi:hypothetical protein
MPRQAKCKPRLVRHQVEANLRKEVNMSNTTTAPLPRDVQTFLKRIVDFYLLGSRDEAFAEWAATRATLMLEYYEVI